MVLSDFISSVLRDIDTALAAASGVADRKYHVKTSDGGGVSFDIAVTTRNTTSSTAEGTAKAGIIEVLGAEVKGKLHGEGENSEVSRIQFTVYVPPSTNAETQENIRRMQSQAIDPIGY